MSTVATVNAVSGSVGLTPTNRRSIVPVSVQAMARPPATPATTSRSPVAATHLTNRDRSAPSAMRMPISRDRSRTRCESTP